MAEHKADARIAVRNLDVSQVLVAAEPIVVADNAIGPGKRVTLQFELRLENGDVIDSGFAKAPVSFVFGDGNLMPGFEQALLGLEAGARREFTLPPEQAFGAVNEDNVQRFPAYQFPADLVLSEGLMIDFSDKAGNAQAGVIRKFDARYVEVDFNHPLAGRTIVFTVHIHAVERVKS